MVKSHFWWVYNYMYICIHIYIYICIYIYVMYIYIYICIHISSFWMRSTIPQSLPGETSTSSNSLWSRSCAVWLPWRQRVGQLLVGGWALPLWKICVRQLGWWNSQNIWEKYGKIKAMFQTTNQIHLVNCLGLLTISYTNYQSGFSHDQRLTVNHQLATLLLLAVSGKYEAMQGWWNVPQINCKNKQCKYKQCKYKQLSSGV